MKGKTTQAILIVFVTACMLALTERAEAAASDPRFFGTYCGTKSVELEVPACFWFICWRDEERFDLNIKAFAKYREPRPGQGVVIGRGVATAAGDIDRRIRDLYDVSPGKKYPFVFSGLVAQRGMLKGSGRAVGLAPAASTASLASDGETITMNAFDLGEIELSKARCGNSAPTASIDNPAADGAMFDWGKVNFLYGSAEDNEDAIEDLQMRWESDRDPDWHFEKRGKTSVNIQDLSTGEHTVTFTVTDGGGRQAVAMRRIRITNELPNAPVIDEPADRASFTAGQCVPFRGRASDSEDGNLTGSSLEWTSDRMPGVMGTGNHFICRPPECPLQPGEHTVTLTAFDRAESSRSTTILITIEPRTGENATPSVWVAEPPNWYTMAADDKVTLVARFCDLEDEILDDDKYEWIVNEVVPGADPVPIPDAELSGVGSQIEYDPQSADPRYANDKRIEVKVRVTDNDGNSQTSEPINIYVIPGIGLY